MGMAMDKQMEEEEEKEEKEEEKEESLNRRFKPAKWC
jgi:hypothetical protein